MIFFLVKLHKKEKKKTFICDVILDFIFIIIIHTN